MSGEVTTPNIGLEVAAYNQGNWQVPTNYNWNLLDLIFGGARQVPALDVLALTVGNIGAVLAAAFVAEEPTGTVPGTVYTLAHTPSLLLGFYVNGVLKRIGLDFTLSGATITLDVATSGGQTVWALYFK